MERKRTRPVTLRGSRGGPSRDWRKEQRLQRLQVPDFCQHCGNSEIDSEYHCDECGFTSRETLEGD